MGRAEQGTGSVVVEPAVKLLIPFKARIENLAFGSNPINNRWLEALCVVGSCTIDTFLNL
jgi:hypothetical protein